jgi:membrane-associated phospholipid phosphatase
MHIIGLRSQDSLTYQLSKNTDLPILISGISLSTYAFFKSSAVEKPTTEQLNSWNRDEVPSWERSATYNWSERASDWSDVAQITATALPLLLFTSGKVRSEGDRVALMYVETFLVNQGLVSSIKSTVLRKRPYVYNDEVNYELKYRKPIFYSFVSGHTATAASMSFFTAKVYADFFPDSPYKKYIWMGACLLPAITGYLRYEGGRHFPSDVIAGYGVGVLTGYLIPHLHKRINRKGIKQSLVNLQGGIGWKIAVQL